MRLQQLRGAYWTVRRSAALGALATSVNWRGGLAVIGVVGL